MNDLFFKLIDKSTFIILSIIRWTLKCVLMNAIPKYDIIIALMEISLA